MPITTRDRFQRLIDWMGKLILLLVYLVGVVATLFVLYLAVKGGLWLVRYLEGSGL